MNVDEALRQLSDAGAIPRDALQWSLDHWDEASRRYLSKLRAAAGRGKPEAADADVLFYIVHLFAEKRDTRAYAPLCQMIADDPAIDEWLGDGVTATLPGLLINLFDGDLEPLHQAIEAVGADPFARASALGALSHLLKSGEAAGEPEFADYLRRLQRKSGPRQASYFWTAWADTIARMGYSALAPEVARLCSKGWIEREEMRIEDFHADLAASRSEPGATELFRRLDIMPFGSTIETLEAWSAPAPGADSGEFEAFADGRPAEPYLNPNREVGRNDPCPCGSGKKYKKCCLAA